MGRVDAAAGGRTGGEVLLVTRGLTGGYGGVPAVFDLDIEISAGEVVALLGPNGAGKTTTLLTVAGLLPSLAGEISVLGEPVGRRRSGRAHRVARRGLAFVPEGTALFFDLTVRENLRLGFVPGRRRADLEGVLDRFPALQDLLGRKAGLLSGGEQRMLGLARALLSRPRLLVLDELSLGLAPLLVKQLLMSLREIADGTGTGIMLVEQQVSMALAAADRAYVLSGGRLVLEGPATELAARHELLETSYLGEVAFGQDGPEET
ncbi:MAG: High-affinity branched-chain amino acid transport ATP-binding protein LivF [Acidimicrobiales bacterium]|nr:MAG: ABC transporter ATP-binding protein [Actinomycetota bacterium]MBV6508037.1 High-affinity branched-chain amino acid transport ATP-binding protein LivF [Acidimicrobiales bacterium]RIK05352.1 MAG: ABC transporter ATP-binding protein [Acidobacteriota bacterium]